MAPSCTRGEAVVLTADSRRKRKSYGYRQRETNRVRPRFAKIDFKPIRIGIFVIRHPQEHESHDAVRNRTEDTFRLLDLKIQSKVSCCLQSRSRVDTEYALHHLDGLSVSGVLHDPQ